MVGGVGVSLLHLFEKRQRGETVADSERADATIAAVAPDLYRGSRVVISVPGETTCVVNAKVRVATPAFVTLDSSESKDSELIHQGDTVSVKGVTRELRPFQLEALVQAIFPGTITLERMQYIPFTERRNSYRQEVFIAGRVLDSDRSIPCEVVDISASGACIQCSEEFTIGAQFSLSFEIYQRAGALVLPCKVVNARSDRDGQSIYGLLFNELSKSRERVLNEHILDIYNGASV